LDWLLRKVPSLRALSEFWAFAAQPARASTVQDARTMFLTFFHVVGSFPHEVALSSNEKKSGCLSPALEKFSLLSS
jgi:hypothetical protein